ncbi:MAG TPA: Trp biosynthesis-associated membrane protein [Micromonosporaceae bacterium]
MSAPDERRRRERLAPASSVVGAGLTLFAATREWVVEVTARPAPLPEVRTGRTGAELMPWLVPLALVALAGAGAVLATRGVVRRGVGGVILAVGASAAAAGVWGATLPQAGASRLWPVLCGLGGLLTAGGGWLVAVRGRDWPSMGDRYERPVAGVAAGERTTAVVWDALDRGEDPTEDGDDLSAAERSPNRDRE